MKLKRLLIMGFVLILMFSLCGCEIKEETDNLQNVTIVLDWFPNTNHTGFYVADQKNYYAEEGLAVEIVQPTEGGTAQLIGAGKGDFGISYQEEVLMARDSHIPVKAIGAIIQHNTGGYASPVEKGITSPADFINRTYGGAGTPSEAALLKALMQNYGQDVTAINQINIGSADFFTSIEKDIDFSLIYYGWTGIEAEVKGIEIDFIPLKDEDERLNFYTPVIIANEDKIKHDALLIEKFMRATSKGYEYAIKNPNEAADILLKAVPELDKELVKASQKYLANEYKSDADKWGKIELERWEGFTNFMYDNNLITEKIEAEQAFTNKFLP